MKYLFYLGHPAHFHLFKNTIQYLSNRHEIILTIKTKDVLQDLVEDRGWGYTNICTTKRSTNLCNKIGTLGTRVLGLYRIIRSHKPDLLVGTSVEIANLGRLLGIPALIVNEDDWDVVPMFSWMSYPLATKILAPRPCRLGRWLSKSIKYDGYHELAYLHPNNFRASKKKIEALGDHYAIIRLADLSAHHDIGKKGIAISIVRELILRIGNAHQVYISSEKPLDRELEKFRYPLAPDTIHDALAFADLYVGDSQTMAAEAAVLGTPSIRFNDFVGRIGYLEELEHRYGLTIGIRTDSPKQLLDTSDALTQRADAKYEWSLRRGRMLRDKIDVAQFMSRVIEGFCRDEEEAGYGTVAAA